jgi:hypothetical protein
MVNPRDIYLDPNFSDQQVYGPPAPSEQAQPRSLLDMLRERSAREMEGENLTRMRDFGAGMLASGSPNFFTNLAAGTRAQAEGERSRTDRLRQLAETERQQRALDIEEQRRREELALRRQELEANAPYRAAQAEQARALAEYYRQGGRGAGAGGPRGQITPERYAQIVSQADAEARQRFPNPASGMPESAAQAAERERRRNEFRDNRVRQILEGAAQIQSGGAPTPSAVDVTAPPAPAARIDARGNPIR